MPFIDVNRSYFRFLILALNCFVNIGSFFCFYIPSVLQYKFQGNVTCDTSANATDPCCSDCVGMSPEEYNLLYAIYAWTNVVVPFGAGFLMDKMGNGVGVIVFSSLIVTGSGIFALGAHLRDSTALLPVMFIGRFLFGAGNGSLSVVMVRVCAFWFQDKELAMAFGTTLASSRFGTILNFLFTVSFAEEFGLVWTLWGGFLLCLACSFASAAVAILDKIGIEQRGLDAAIRQESSNLRFADVRYFSALYWLIVLATVFFFNSLFPFTVNSSQFIIDKYAYQQTHASYTTGAIYYISILSPLAGFLFDVFGKRAGVALAFSLITVPSYALLGFTDLPPAISTVVLGISYSVVAASLFPSIPLVVHPSAVGMATGLCLSIQNLGAGICSLVVGAILRRVPGNTKEERIRAWQFVIVFMMCNSFVCLVANIFLNVLDRLRTGVLNQSNKEREERFEEAQREERLRRLDTIVEIERGPCSTAEGSVQDLD